MPTQACAYIHEKRTEPAPRRNLALRSTGDITMGGIITCICTQGKCILIERTNIYKVHEELTFSVSFPAQHFVPVVLRGEA